MRKLKASAYWILSLLLLGANLAQAEPLLNGIAIHQELGRDQFIGALYSDVLSSDAATFMSAGHPMRMELKVTAESGISARKFSRMWIEGMAINIHGNALTEQADNMVSFTKLFQARLLQNDHVVFALNPDQGVTVSVNTVALGTIAEDDFFGLLLSTWLGRVPLSSNYREQLLVSGDVDNSLRGRYASIAPTPARINQVALWSAPKPEPKPTVQPQPEPEVAAAVSSPAPSTKASLPKIEIPSTRTVVAAADDDTDGGDEAALEVAQAESSSAPKPSSSSSSVASSSSIASSTGVAPKPDPLDESDDDYVPTFTAESLLANQRYFSHLVRQVQSEINYPRRAMQRGYEGSIRIAITINRNGELLESTLIEETAHSILNKEAINAVSKSQPFPPVPEVISGRSHEFTIPITFTLQQ